MRRWEELAMERAEAKEEGREEGRTLEIYSMVQDGDISPERGARRLGITVEVLKDRMSASGDLYSKDMIQKIEGYSRHMTS